MQAVHFLGEKDGPPEQELKNTLVILFGQLRLVNIAYLAVVRYGDARYRRMLRYVFAVSPVRIGSLPNVSAEFLDRFSVAMNTLT